MVITLNGERYELEQPVSVIDLLAALDIDPVLLPSDDDTARDATQSLAALRLRDIAATSPAAHVAVAAAVSRPQVTSWRIASGRDSPVSAIQTSSALI